MARLCTTQVFHTAEPVETGSMEGSILIRFDIYVDLNGQFSTTLPTNVVQQLMDAQIDLESNRLGNKGYCKATLKTA